MWTVVGLLLAFVALVAAQQQEPSLAGNVTFIVEHALSDNVFKFRTKIQLVSRADGKQGTLYLDKNSIGGDDVQQLKALVDRQGLYTVRLRTEREDSTARPVISSIPVVSLHVEPPFVVVVAVFVVAVFDTVA